MEIALLARRIAVVVLFRVAQSLELLNHMRVEMDYLVDFEQLAFFSVMACPISYHVAYCYLLQIGQSNSVLVIRQIHQMPIRC